ATDSPGSPNPETYKKVFELILRLKANTLWPAMHNLSDAFNKEINPETGIAYNAELADAYGVVMGSSHCELMLCNNETEWVPWCERNVGKYGLKKINNSWKSSYDYTVNAEAMNAYWEERVATNYRFDNIYTIGLRGVHDSEILCSALSDKSWASKATVVQSAVEAQLDILRKYEAIRSEELGYEVTFPTCYAVYKEAAEYYKYDLSLPESCIILFCDDNYGYVRQMPNEEELATYEGFGVYYHVSYYGVPRSYLWIDTMPLSNIYAEMDKAFQAGEDDLWILNVGDLKPAEISINFFMDLAWDEDSITRDSLNEYLANYFKETFTLSNDDALTLAKTMNEFYQLAFAYKPEYQGYGEGTEYSGVYVGDEAERMINLVSEITALSAAISEKLPESERTSYQQIVHYKFVATLLTLQKNVYEQKNALYLSQGRFASVNAYAMLSEAAHKAVLQSVIDYCALSNGKWEGIMNPYQTAQGLPVIAGAPTVTYLSEDVATDGVGAAVEGQLGNAPV
ncbi:MAG: glycosyl hydrolase 115 family protein, partial [Clostridia bacterium]|nr:glycosyl hydrolase 115 family protein [Clostridia bacterium]